MGSNSIRLSGSGTSGVAAPTFGPIDAVVFDTDGVITRTAELHRAAWKRLFDDYLMTHGGDRQRPFSDEDYLAHVDGRPRYDGVETFLSSRRIDLAYGERADAPDVETVCGLGNRKDEYFQAEVAKRGVHAYDTTIAFMDALRSFGVVMAAVSASENQRLVLESAGLLGSFDVLVDGVESRELGLAGKPDPALFLEAAARLAVEPARTAVLEDARSGVAAGRAGGFGTVIGVNRGGRPDSLRAAGADVVVDDLEDLSVHQHPDGGCQLHVEDRS